MFGENDYLCIMENIEYISIKNEDDLLNKLFDLGYEWYANRPNDEIINDCKDDSYLFICLNGVYYGELGNGKFQDSDYIVNIDDIPLRKELDDFIKVLEEGTKLGLL